MDLVANLIAALETRDCKPRKSGDSWEAKCPAHDDKRASLSVAEGKEGRALLTCHAGCELESILSALGLTERDLFSSQERSTRATIAATYKYTDESGALLYEVLRYRPKNFKQRRPDGKGGWLWKVGGVRRVLYHLVEVHRAIAQGKRIYFPEGEKDVDNLRALGLTATTAAGGAKAPWNADYSEQLRGAAEVVLLADNDAPGKERVETVARALGDAVKVVKTLLLPNLSAKGDVSDWLAAGGTIEELERLAIAAPRWTPTTSAANAEDGDQEDLNGAPAEPKASSKAEARNGGAAIPLIEIGSKLALLHDAGGIAYAVRPLASGGTRTVCLSSSAFRSFLAGEYHRQSGGKKAAPADAINTAIGVLAARALESACEDVHVRVAEQGEAIYLDLADDAGGAVEISPEGWRVTTRPPVRFRRERGMLPLPVPERGGNLEELRSLINAPGEVEWRLLVAWLIASLRPGRPFPVLVLQGEQGSAKSTTGRLLRGLIDPARPPDRARPRDERDLAIAARNSWVLAYDNLSGLPEWLSDGLCRLATGGGFATRKLYADDDEAIFDFCRPVMLNGIDELLTRPDLADRALRVTLPSIADEDRRTAAAVLAEYDAARPRILGALCDAVSGAIRGLPAAERRVTKPTRMADFALWASAAEDALGWREGAFLESYVHNRGELVSESLEDDLVASAVQTLLADIELWTGTASELLKRLAEISGIGERPPRNWPTGPRALSGRLRRASPLLRRIGIQWKPPEGQTGPSRDRRHTLLRKQPFAPFTPFPPPAQPSPNPAQSAENEGGDIRGSPNGRERSANGRKPQPFGQSPSEMNGPNGANGALYTSGLDPRNRAAGDGEVIDMLPDETEEQAEARRNREGALKWIRVDRAMAAKARAEGRIAEAERLERSAAEAEKKIAGNAVISEADEAAHG